MKEIKLVVDNGKVYTIQSEELVEIVIKKYDVALDLDYLKIVITGNRPEISDVLLVDTILYGKEHKIKELVIGDKVYNNEGKGYNSLCTIDASGHVVIELLNEDSYCCEFKCKSDPEHLEMVMTEYIELVALIERIVTKMVFKDKRLDVEKLVALSSVYDFLISLDDINLVGYKYCIDSMLIHKYFLETPEGIHNERIEEIISKKRLFIYGFVVNNKFIKNAINIISEHFTDYSLDNLKNMVKVYEELFTFGEEIGFCDYENYEEEKGVQAEEKDKNSSGSLFDFLIDNNICEVKSFNLDNKEEEPVEETAETVKTIPEELFGFLGDISKVHYSGSADDYDCFE